MSLEYLSVFLIVLGAGFLRLYRIGDYLTFLGDEGRDALVVKGILEGRLTLLGPRASAGDFFLGPIYYYFMAPFLWLWHLDPVGPAIMIGIIGTITVYLVYFLGKRFFGTLTGIFAAALYAVSPVIIAYSRSSWNPNPMPFISLLILYLLYLAISQKKTKLFLIIGILFGVAMQLHYLATFLGVIMVVYIFVAQKIRDGKLQPHYLFSSFLRIVGGFLIGFSPFLAFEARHGFQNTKVIVSFIFGNTFSSQYKANATFFTIISDVFFRLFGRLMTRFPPPEQVSIQSDSHFAIWYYLSLLLAFASVGFFLWQLYKFIKKKNKEMLLQYSLIAVWFFLGIFLFAFYKKPIYDYYFGFMFPLPFLLVGNFLENIARGKLKLLGMLISGAIFFYLISFNLQGAPFLSSPNRQKDQVKLIADYVLTKTEGKPYNFALLTHGNSDHAYRYFFELAGRPPVTIDNTLSDPERKTVTDQLLIVCEDTQCQPLGNSLFEVAGFGRAEIVGKWDVSVVKIYKLGHYKGKTE